MAGMQGTLTASQHEIMRVVWAAGDEGITVADIWQQIAGAREIGRTTVLNQVDRLEKRGWLRRRDGAGVNRFVATTPRENADRRLAAEFVNDFFDGSAADLLSTLLGAAKLTRADVRRLRKLLDQSGPAPEEQS